MYFLAEQNSLFSLAVQLVGLLLIHEAGEQTSLFGRQPSMPESGGQTRVHQSILRKQQSSTDGRIFIQRHHLRHDLQGVQNSRSQLLERPKFVAGQTGAVSPHGV